MYWLHKSLKFLMNCRDNVNPIARRETTFRIHAGPLTAMASDPHGQIILRTSACKITGGGTVPIAAVDDYC